MKKTVLITGGLGFIGSHLIERLKDNYDITIVDNLSNDKIFCPKYCRLFICDIRNFKTDEYFDYVIHLAAIAVVSDKFDPEMISVNCAGFENIYKNIKCGKFIYATTCAALNCKNDYGKTKAHNEYIAKDSLGFRFYNVYGKNDNGIVSRFLKPHPVLFGGDQVRDFVYVKDLVRFIADNLDKKGILEVGTGVGTSMLEVAKLIGRPYEQKESRGFDEQKLICQNPINFNYTLEQGIQDMQL